MEHKRIFSPAVLRKLSIAVILLLLVSIGTPVEAGGGGGLSYSILAETARPIDSTIQYDNFWGFLYTTAASTLHPGTVAYIAQFNLPDGAQILGVTAEGVDNNDPSIFSVRLYRYGLAAYPPNVYETLTLPAMSSSVTPGTNGRVSVFAPFDPALDPNLAVVNNAAYSYGAYISLPKASVNTPSMPTLALLRVVVLYKNPVAVFLPNVTN